MFILRQREQLFPPVVCAHEVTHLCSYHLLFARAPGPRSSQRKSKGAWPRPGGLLDFRNLHDNYYANSH